MEPIALNQHWQLFLDDHACSRVTGFDRVVHRPRPCGVVLPADRPWETAGIGLDFVDRREDGSFLAFYRAMWWDAGIAQARESDSEDLAHHVSSAMAYATSEDGIHWSKPDLGLLEAPAGVDGSCAPYPQPKGSSTRNNLGAPFSFIQDLGRYGNVCDPQKRYAVRLDPQETCAICANWQYSSHGYFLDALPDFPKGVGWRERLVDSGGAFNPRRHTLHFWDEIHDEWVAMEQGVIGHWLPSREIARMASGDLIAWTSDAALYPDAADPHTPQCYDEPMSLTPFCAEGVVFGLLSWFHSDRSHPDGGPNPEPSEAHPHRWPWCRKGTNEMRITLSRDGGKTWDRTSSREAWVPHGTEHDSYDRMVIGAVPPVRVGEEDWFYMSVMDGDHLAIRNNSGQTPYYADRLRRGQIARYTQKHNRYVSLRANNAREILITKPIVIAGDSLYVNVDASRGQFRVGIALAEPVGTQKDQATPSAAPHLLEHHMIAGFTFDDCEPVSVNSIEHRVQFGNGDTLASLREKPVRLFFEVFDADLYGFRAV
ncbi:MAG: hypothetical protein V1800_00190 [Candidatus Latescibacterota bacterium]